MCRAPDEKKKKKQIYRDRLTVAVRVGLLLSPRLESRVQILYKPSRKHGRGGRGRVCATNWPRNDTT